MKEKCLELLGRYIKACRLKSSLTQKEVALKMGKSPGWVYQIENGNFTLSYSDCIQLSLVIGMDEKVCLSLLPAKTHENVDSLLKEINEFKNKNKKAA